MTHAVESSIVGAVSKVLHPLVKGDPRIHFSRNNGVGVCSASGYLRDKRPFSLTINVDSIGVMKIVSVVAGSYKAGPIPGKYDASTLPNVLHQLLGGKSQK